VLSGQAPSDYPEFARFLGEQGIDSIGLNPDSVIKTSLEIAQVEVCSGCSIPLGHDRLKEYYKTLGNYTCLKQWDLN
jgi:hypothetical protein